MRTTNKKRPQRWGQFCVDVVIGKSLSNALRRYRTPKLRDVHQKRCRIEHTIERRHKSGHLPRWVGEGCWLLDCEVDDCVLHDRAGGAGDRNCERSGWSVGWDDIAVAGTANDIAGGDDQDAQQTEEPDVALFVGRATPGEGEDCAEGEEESRGDSDSCRSAESEGAERGHLYGGDGDGGGGRRRGGYGQLRGREGAGGGFGQTAAGERDGPAEV